MSNFRNLFFLAMLAAFCISNVSSLRVFKAKAVHTKLHFDSKMMEPSPTSSLSLASLSSRLTPALVLLGPSLAIADDGGSRNAFVYPLAISFLTIVPFLIYQQALKPKPRTVKQIELDENLRPKEKPSAGKIGDAKAGKRK
eukprot:gene29238-38306_t